VLSCTVLQPPIHPERRLLTIGFHAGWPLLHDSPAQRSDQLTAMDRFRWFARARALPICHHTDQRLPAREKRPNGFELSPPPPWTNEHDCALRLAASQCMCNCRPIGSHDETDTARRAPCQFAVHARHKLCWIFAPRDLPLAKDPAEFPAVF